MFTYKSFIFRTGDTIVISKTTKFGIITKRYVVESCTNDSIKLVNDHHSLTFCPNQLLFPFTIHKHRIMQIKDEMVVRNETIYTIFIDKR